MQRFVRSGIMFACLRLAGLNLTNPITTADNVQVRRLMETCLS